ncbi:MAG: CBS domain-containing protein [archaeon]
MEIKVYPALVCKEDDSISKIAKLLKSKNERRIFVVDKDKKLVGIITTTDLVYNFLATSKKEMKAKEIMTKKVLSINKEDTIEKALDVMNKIKTYICPVVNDGKIVGVLRHNDIVKFLMSK